MPKRQERVDPGSIDKRIGSLTGKFVSFIMKNDQVFYAKILSYENNLIKVENNRKAIHAIPLNEVAEIIVDY